MSSNSGDSTTNSPRVSTAAARKAGGGLGLAVLLTDTDAQADGYSLDQRQVCDAAAHEKLQPTTGQQVQAYASVRPRLHHLLKQKGAE